MRERMSFILDRIRRFLTAPTFEGDDERTRQAELLNTVLLAWFAGSLIMAALARFLRLSPRLGMIVGLPLSVMVILLWILTRCGYVRLVSVLFPLGQGLFFIVLTYVLGGIGESNYPRYIAVVLIAGLLLGGRAAVIAAGSGILIGLAMLVIETQGLLPPAIAETPLSYAWLNGALNLAMSALILYLATKNIDTALERLRHNQRALAESNRELQHEIAERRRAETALQQAHDELEVRVRERTAALAQANTALQNQIGERTRAEKQIRTSLQEKEVLLQEIHHRVKNNLQVISSLLNLQSVYIDDDQLRTVFVDSQNRIRSMALVHERLYRSSNIAQIEFGTYIRQLTQQLLDTYQPNLGRITLDIDAPEDIALAIDEAVPCGLILNELVSNALKHAFPDGRSGKISVALRREDSELTILTVQDNGIGLPEELDLDNSDSLGMQLVATLANQLDGTLELERQGGTTFRVVFAIPPTSHPTVSHAHTEELE